MAENEIVLKQPEEFKDENNPVRLDAIKRIDEIKENNPNMEVGKDVINSGIKANDLMTMCAENIFSENNKIQERRKRYRS